MQASWAVLCRYCCNTNSMGSADTDHPICFRCYRKWNEWNIGKNSPYRSYVESLDTWEKEKKIIESINVWDKK